METYQKNQRIIILSLVCFFVLLSDQLSKYWAIESLKGTRGYHLLSGHLKIIYQENRGAWGGLGSNWGDLERFLFLIALPVLVLIGFAVFSVISQKLKKPEIWAYALVVAGGAGNLIDRIFYGYVVDFMWFGIPTQRYLQTNIFNIADVVIMTGFGILVYSGYLEWKEQKQLAKS